MACLCQATWYYKNTVLLAGSFGAMDPASNDLYMFLEKLQQQQKEVVALIKERQRIIAAKNGDSPSPVTADAAVMGVSPSLKSVTGLWLPCSVTDVASASTVRLVQINQHVCQ